MLAFLIDRFETSRWDIGDLFPLKKESSRRVLAEMFNGGRWETINPHYTENIGLYAQEFGTL